jgi:predicted nucleotidyltransferase
MLHVFENHPNKYYKFTTVKLIEEKKEKLLELCESHNVKELYLFGSILTTRFLDSSDIDVLVQFDDIELEKYVDNYIDFKEQLEMLFERQVDLVENQAIRNPIFRKVVDREKQLVYERKNS